jgi:hypothetical protein
MALSNLDKTQRHEDMERKKCDTRFRIQDATGSPN